MRLASSNKKVMKRNLLIFGLVLTVSACQDQNGPLEGTWEMVSATYTDADTTTTLVLSDVRATKILTSDHFAFGRQQDEGAYAGGGMYTYQDGSYTEVIQFHSNSDWLTDTLQFKARIEGDSLWYHSGTLGENFVLDEIWRRVSH